jgi:hypothetical protein
MQWGRWGRKHKDLQPKITNTLAKAYADVSRPLTTHYGAIVALKAFGVRVTHASEFHLHFNVGNIWSVFGFKIAPGDFSSFLLMN